MLYNMYKFMNMIKSVLSKCDHDQFKFPNSERKFREDKKTDILGPTVELIL